jgi:hypothetical protein
MLFDGATGYIVNSRVVTTSNVSLSCWVVIPSVPASAGRIGGWVNGNGSGTADKILSVTSAGLPQWEIYNGNTRFVTGSVSICDGLPHHVVGTYDATGQFLYVDGALVASGPYSTASYAGYTVPCIQINGSNGGAAAATYLAATQWAFLAHNRALSGNEVALLYAAPFAGLRPLVRRTRVFPQAGGTAYHAAGTIFSFGAAGARAATGRHAAGQTVAATSGGTRGAVQRHSAVATVATVSGGIASAARRRGAGAASTIATAATSATTQRQAGGATAAITASKTAGRRSLVAAAAAFVTTTAGAAGAAGRAATGATGSAFAIVTTGAAGSVARFAAGAVAVIGWVAGAAGVPKRPIPGATATRYATAPSVTRATSAPSVNRSTTAGPP